MREDALRRMLQTRRDIVAELNCLGSPWNAKGRGGERRRRCLIRPCRACDGMAVRRLAQHDRACAMWPAMCAAHAASHRDLLIGQGDSRMAASRLVVARVPAIAGSWHSPEMTDGVTACAAATKHPHAYLRERTHPYDKFGRHRIMGERRLRPRRHGCRSSAQGGKADQHGDGA